MDGEKLYQCDPRKNAACRKRMCHIYGGECELTSHAEYAANDPAGRPIEINPRECLREKMKRKKDRKMSKYIVKAELNPMGGGNPEFASDQELVKGIEADGFVLMTMKEDHVGAVVIHRVTTMDLARMLVGDKTVAGSVIRQAIAIAEGLGKAAKIAEEESKIKWQEISPRC